MFTPGTILAGKYELLEIAGQGGMATVWRAQTHGAGGFSRAFAIKVMLQRLCNDPHFVELFVEEARVSSRLQHPNVVQISDFGEHEGVYFLAMEWVDGLDLLDYARSFTEQGYYMPWAALAIVAVEVLKGLHAAHHHRDEMGQPSPIFHRDVTPHNILLGTNGVVKLTDFGLAKATDRGTMTLPHVLKGKISYTAPEMTRGVRANARTDIFSLGVTLWEALAGRKMFDATSPLQVVKQIQAWSIPALKDLRPDLPADLVLTVERAIARDPDQRFASAQEFAATLSSLLPPLPDMQRLGKSIADARQRMRQAKQAEDLDHLKESLRPAIPARTPTFRPASPDGRAARAPRGAPPPLPPAPRPPPGPVAPPSSGNAPPPPNPARRSSSAPPPAALNRSAPPTSVPIPSSLSPVRISEKIPSISVVLDELSAELITPESPPPAPPAAPPRAAPGVAPPARSEERGGPATQISPPLPRRPSPTAAVPPEARKQLTPTPPPSAPSGAPSSGAPPPASPKPRSRPSRFEELDISIELELPARQSTLPATPKNNNPEKK